ncbi:MAG TPA: biotin/lipoyl-containing protein [Candidatus Limnocylindrales bacterium]|nr:biotin/lipoyl-containing protein [Candidatus Limnocylindrales bacterium]
MRRYTVVVDGTAYTIDVEETAADRFEVTVGDQVFEATLEADEDLPGAAISPEMFSPDDARTPAAVPNPAARPAPAPARAALPPRTTPGTPGLHGAGSDVLAAPMPGVVLEVVVAAGAVLKRGDPILVLEAMKMRNTIRAPRAAVVLSVEVEAGQPVGPGDPLVRLGAAPG